MIAIDRLLFPIRWLLGQLGSGVSRLFGLEGRADDEEQEFREEILDAVSGGEQTGVIEETHAEMIEKLVDFRDRAVSEVMTTRTRIVSVPSTRRSRARSPPRTSPAIRGSRFTRARSTASSGSSS